MPDTSRERDLKRANAGAEVPSAISDRGCERELNEDRWVSVRSDVGTAWVVCDGMGGVVGGDLAAQLAIDQVKRVIERTLDMSSEQVLRLAIEEANRVIVLRRQNPDFSKMGTTVVGVMESDGQYTIAHAGDSRAYLIRGETTTQLTVDHTYVQQLVDEGKISQEEAYNHPQAHVLTRCLGATAQLKLDVANYWCWPAPSGEPNDKILLCSDGLYSLVDDDEIGDAVNNYSSHECCGRLVELAKLRGGCDNITIIVVPIPGRLSDERPTVSVSRSRKRVTKRKDPMAPQVSPVTRVMFMGAMFIAGVVSGLIYSIVKLWNSVGA